MQIYDEDESKSWKEFWGGVSLPKTPETSILGVKVILSETVPEDTVVVGQKLFKILSDRV